MNKRIPDFDDSHFVGISTLRLLLAFNNLFDGLSGCFKQKRTWERARTLAYGLLCSESPHTITNWLMAAGLQDVDWTRSYDFFSHASWSVEDIFKIIQGYTAGYFSGCSAFFAALVPSSDAGIAGPVRGVPIDFRHAPVAKKPGKNATQEQLEMYKRESKEKSISVQGLEAIKDMRKSIDKNSLMKDKPLVMSVDGSFTNGTVFGDVPANTVIVGRVAKNIALYSPPPPYPGVGRRRKYGERCHSPEELRQDDSIPWQKTRIYACGKWHDVEYKTMSPVLWKSVTKDKPLRLIAIRPLSYRPSKKSKLMYREPVYLLVSDPDYPVELALLASLKAYGPSKDGHYGPVAKWRNDYRPRPSAKDIVRQLKREMQQAGIMSFEWFAVQAMSMQTIQNSVSLEAISCWNGGSG